MATAPAGAQHGSSCSALPALSPRAPGTGRGEEPELPVPSFSGEQPQLCQQLVPSGRCHLSGHPPRLAHIPGQERSSLTRLRLKLSMSRPHLNAGTPLQLGNLPGLCPCEDWDRGVPAGCPCLRGIPACGVSLPQAPAASPAFAGVTPHFIWKR